MALTLSGTNGVVGAGFTLDASGASVTAGVGTFSSLQGSAASLTQIPAASIVGLCTAGLASASGFLTGLTMADQWRVTSNFNSADTDITSNWERTDDTSALIGDGMTESSGIFTFPSTGQYLIMFHFHGYNSTQSRYVGGTIALSTDSGSNYTTRAQQYNSVASDTNVYAGGSTTLFVDVTSTSTHKVKFQVNHDSPYEVKGSTDELITYVIFKKLAET